jgi:hypothetical protein
MSGLRSRLAKLERVALEAVTTCTGCVAVPARFLIQYPHPPPPPPELDEEYRVCCAVCGRERTGTTIVMRLLGPREMKNFDHGMTDFDQRVSAA